jgi:hypothetical protein
VRALVPVGLSALLLLAAPTAASADVIFDPADADDLAATLAEAAAQDVCYGWDVDVDDAYTPKESVGSDRGAGIPVDTTSCSKYVILDVDITWTSESSESEDSASYDVVSSAGGPSKSDLDGLDLDFDGLTGEDPDVVIGNAVSALPLLAADKGMGKAIEAAPASGEAPADASLTDDPGSDWFRNNGGTMLWGLGLLLAGGVFFWWVFRSRPRKPEPYVNPYTVPDTVPDDLVTPAYEPPTAPIEVPKPDPEPEPDPDATRPVAAPKPEKPQDPAPEPPAPSEEDVAPTDQKDKE